MRGRLLGRRAAAGAAFTLLLGHLGYQVAQALGSPILGVVAANLLFVLTASVWTSIAGRGRSRSR